MNSQLLSIAIDTITIDDLIAELQRGLDASASGGGHVEEEEDEHNVKRNKAGQVTKRPGPRGPRRPKNPLDAKGKEILTMTADVITQQIFKCLDDPDTYEQYSDRGIAEHRHSFADGDGKAILTISLQSGEGWENIITAVQNLGPGVKDTLSAALALAIDFNGIDHIREPIRVNPDTLLEICRKKKTNGSSFSPAQRAEIIKDLKTLSQSHVIVTAPLSERKRNKPGRKRKGAPRNERTYIRAQGALIDLLSFKIGEYNLITGEEIWEERSISIGEWVAQIPGLSRQTAVMLRQVLAYSAKNQIYQKELGRYLTFMFRINAHKPGGTFECSMKALLDGAGFKVPRNIGEFREAIEKALADLKRDNVIGDYAQIVDTRPNAAERQAAILHHDKGWWDFYAALKWRFHPPAYVREQYRKMVGGPEASNYVKSN